jgi:hypothetical protein
MIWRRRVSSGGGVYRLERRGRGIIWSRRVLSVGVCIIWNRKVSSRVGECHQEGCVSSGRGGYHPEQESIIWIGEGVMYLRE